MCVHVCVSVCVHAWLRRRPHGLHEVAPAQNKHVDRSAQYKHSRPPSGSNLVAPRSACALPALPPPPPFLPSLALTHSARVKESASTRERRGQRTRRQRRSHSMQMQALIHTQHSLSRKHTLAGIRVCTDRSSSPLNLLFSSLQSPLPLSIFSPPSESLLFPPTLVSSQGSFDHRPSDRSNPLAGA